MKAIAYSAFGPAAKTLSLQEVPTPTPQPGEVLVRLVYSGANPSDVKSRAGIPGLSKPAFDLVIPHSDGAGVITAVGQGVSSARIGERVWVWNGQWRRAHGTAAPYIALPSAQAVPMDDTMSFEVGACLGIPGLTAAHCVFGGGPIEDKTLLISGGGGSVGHIAVQLAKWGGATVIATGSPRDFDRIRGYGADHVFDYRDPDLAQKITQITGASGIDRAIEVEFGLNAALLAIVMGENSTISVYGSALDMTPTLPFRPYLFKAITIDIALIYLLQPGPRDAAITALHLAHTAGAMTPDILAIFDLADCVKAHETIEAGQRSGAVLLRTST